MSHPPKQSDSMKALSESAHLDFSKIEIRTITVGDIEIFGGCVLSVKPPSKGAPYWEIRYDIGNGVAVLYAASTPVKIEAVEIKQEQEEEVVDDDE